MTVGRKEGRKRRPSITRSALEKACCQISSMASNVATLQDVLTGESDTKSSSHCVDHKRTVLSVEPETNIVPSPFPGGMNATDSISLSRPLQGTLKCPLPTPHSRIVQELYPAANVSPPGENAMELTQPSVWASNVLSALPV